MLYWLGLLVLLVGGQLTLFVGQQPGDQLWLAIAGGFLCFVGFRLAYEAGRREARQ